MDDIGRIRAFIDTINHKGFTAAARHNEVAVSSIARQVKALEEDLGLRLINRNTRNQSLTEAGALFYERICPVVRDLDAVRRDVQSLHADLGGTLKVTIRHSASVMVLPNIATFLARHPNLTLDLSLVDERFDLVSERVDIAVWLGEMHDSSLIGRKLARSKRVICASPDYFDRHGMPEKPEDLTDHNCLIFKAPNHPNAWHFTRGDESILVPVRGNLRSATGLVLLESALGGLGLALVQEYMARPMLASGRLRTVFSEYEVSPTSEDTWLYLVYPSNRGVSPATRAFIDFLVECFGPID